MEGWVGGGGEGGREEGFNVLTSCHLAWLLHTCAKSLVVA